MNSTMMVERTGMTLPGMGMPGVGTPALGTPTGTPTGANWLMVPRCTLRFEKCTGGVKINCICDDKMACSMVQNLCTMLAGGMCSCCVQLNGLTVCVCNFTVGLCRCDVTENGVCITCTSGDTKCGEIIQSYCDCLTTLVNAGCTCCVLMNSTPICCGTSDTAATQAGSKAGGKR